MHDICFFNVIYLCVLSPINNPGSYLRIHYRCFSRHNISLPPRPQFAMATYRNDDDGWGSRTVNKAAAEERQIERLDIDVGSHCHIHQNEICQ